MEMLREKTKTVRIGDVLIGGGHTVAIQSMTNTRTEDVESTAAQIRKLEAAGLRDFITTKKGIGYLIE